MVKAEKSDGFWRLAVSDSGQGMNATMLEKIRTGESFSTLGTNKEKGHGLGLQLVRDFLKLHGSNLEVESEVGKGTTFRFQIASA